MEILPSIHNYWRIEFGLAESNCDRFSVLTDLLWFQTLFKGAFLGHTPMRSIYIFKLQQLI